MSECYVTLGCVRLRLEIVDDWREAMSECYVTLGCVRLRL